MYFKKENFKFQTSWETKSRIPNLMEKYGKSLEIILHEIKFKVGSKSNDAKYTFFVGENYGFNSFLNDKDKNKATSELYILDNIVTIGLTDGLEEISKLFKNKIFYKPSKYEVRLFSNPKNLLALEECYVFVKIKKVTIGKV